MKVAYQTDANGIYIGQVPCQESPLEPGVYLIPGGATEVAPPKNLPEGHVQRFVWKDQAWEVIESPALIEARLEEERLKNEEKNQKDFASLPHAEKLERLVQIRDHKMSAEVDTALQRLTWWDWAGEPLPAESKKDWILYRRALLTALPENVDLSSLENMDEFAWPEMPAMPPDVA